MEILLGFIGLTFGLLITTLLIFTYPNLRLLLFTAFFTRASAALVNIYIVTLPDGGADAIAFQNFAAGVANQGFIEAFREFPGYGTGWGYPWLVGLVYSITGESVLLMHAFSVLMGVGTVLYTYRLAKLCWDEEVALRSAWIVALFPTLIMYSALTLREVFVAFFVLLAFVNMARWLSGRAFSFLFYSFFGFFLAGFFHGGALVGALVFSILVFMIVAIENAKLILRGRLRISLVFQILSVCLFLTLYFKEILYIPYIGSFSITSFQYNLMEQLNRVQVGNSVYPLWLLPNDILEYFLMLPVRFLYFLAAPFPWDVTSIRHLPGVIDGILYAIFFSFIFRRLRVLLLNPTTCTILLVLVCLLLVYAAGTGNFGTGLRHRAKFVAIIVVLCAPFFPKIRV